MWGMPTFNFTLNVRPEMSTEPTHFLRLMNNVKAFSNLDSMACNYQCLTSFSFYQDTGKPKYWISWDLKKPNLFKNNLNKIRNNFKSKIKKERNGGIVELLIPTFFQKKASHEGTKPFLGKKTIGRLF